MKQSIFFVLLYFTASCFKVNNMLAQEFDKEPHKRISSISKNLRDSVRSNPEAYLVILTEKLTSDVMGDFEKVKIIHDWIVTEISYDNEIYLRPSYQVYETYDVLKKKKAICVGYCNLFKKMCEYAGIECISISGFAKTLSDSAESLPKEFSKPNHQWNAVKINGNWYLIDVTWDAGYTLNESFIFQYSTNFLLQDPHKFIYHHFPKEEKWQLLTHPVNWTSFRKLKYEPTNSLSLNNTSVKGGINFSRLYNLVIPDMIETNGFNLNLSGNKKITNELGLEGELSFEHINVNQDFRRIWSSQNFNNEKGIYTDPVTMESAEIGSFGFEKIGVGLNLNYHFQNETMLLPFLKTGFSISSPLSFGSNEIGMIVTSVSPNGESYNGLRRVRNFDLFDQVLYTALISCGIDLVRKEETKNDFHQVIGLELKWSFLLNSISLFKDFDEGTNKLKSYSINLVYYF